MKRPEESLWDPVAGQRGLFGDDEMPPANEPDPTQERPTGEPAMSQTAAQQSRLENTRWG